LLANDAGKLPMKEIEPFAGVGGFQEVLASEGIGNERVREHIGEGIWILDHFHCFVYWFRQAIFLSFELLQECQYLFAQVIGAIGVADGSADGAQAGHSIRVDVVPPGKPDPPDALKDKVRGAVVVKN
jgi:hypothetical protein